MYSTIYCNILRRIRCLPILCWLWSSVAIYYQVSDHYFFGHPASYLLPQALIIIYADLLLADCTQILFSIQINCLYFFPLFKNLCKVFRIESDFNPLRIIHLAKNYLALKMKLINHWNWMENVTNWLLVYMAVTDADNDDADISSCTGYWII